MDTERHFKIVSPLLKDEEKRLKILHLYIKSMFINIMKDRKNEPVEVNEMVNMINEEKKIFNGLLDKIKISDDTINDILGLTDEDDYKLNNHYFTYKHYKIPEEKEFIIDIMKKRNNEKLELIEAITILTNKGFKGITTRTIRKTLSFNDTDEYEIKRDGKKNYIVYKNDTSL